ncbi:MAG: hypothetical protein FWC32_05560 [Firmicutes bacterium]|nr:hypothetical protein [Bacillota bacterium]
MHDANCEIYYFVTSDITPEGRFKLMRVHDTERHYTFNWPDDKLRSMCGNLIEESKFIKEQCAKYNLPYYETANNREQVFEEFCQMTAEKREREE